MRWLILISLVLCGCSGLEDHSFTVHEFNCKIHTMVEGPHGLVKIDERKAP